MLKNYFTKLCVHILGYLGLLTTQEEYIASI